MGITTLPMLSQGRKFLSHVVPAILRPLRVLWNEVVGFIFIAFAVVAMPRTWQAWREFDGEPQALFRLLLASVFLLTMLIFGVGSFLRARKISRS
jgi:hypothetical protein